jgi:hypothetical protein
MKDRILLFLFYQMISIASLVVPRTGLEIIADHNAAEKRRRELQRASGASVGDKL